MLPTVILFGNEKDKTMTEPLFRITAERYRVTLLEKNGVRTCGNGSPVLMIDTPRLKLQQNERCLILLKRRRDLRQLKMPPHTTTVFSLEKPLPKKLLSLHPQGIACGGREGSLSFSSLSPDKGIVSLQRSMTDYFGSTVEPMEIAVEIGRTDPYTILACTAAALWLHQSESKLTF